MKVHGIYGFFVACAGLSFAGVARAEPMLRAELHWQGSCDDAEDLLRQVRTRGAELELRDPRVPVDASETAPVRVEVRVQSAGSSSLSAEIQLRNEAGQELRRVQANACGELRSAVAWVLVVLAQESAPEHAPLVPARGASSTAAFPDASAPAPPPAIAASPAGVALPDAGRSPAPRADSKDEHVSRWGLGCSFTAAFGLVPAPAVGPTLFARYRPNVAWLPVLQLSVQRLVTLGFESNGTSLSLTRDAARVGVWVPLVRQSLSLGLSAEAGRLVASGSGATLEHGSSDSAFWFAFGVPVRVSVPLIRRFLQAEFQAELDYSPVPYTFRYGSGDTLTSTNAFEGRGQIGLVSLF